MNDDRNDIARLLAALDEPEPPGALRERTLARAQSSWNRPPVPDSWNRVWHSRPLRLAWAAAVVALVVANAALRSGSQARPRTAAADAASREAAGLAELQAVVELPRIRPEYAGIGAPQGRAIPPGDSNPTTQRNDLEDKS